MRSSVMRIDVTGRGPRRTYYGWTVFGEAGEILAEGVKITRKGAEAVSQQFMDGRAGRLALEREEEVL